MRRVLISADAVGGAWTYALDLARGLCARGDEVLLAALGPSPSGAQCGAARDAGISLLDTGLPLDWIAEDEAELGRAAQGLADTAVTWRAEIVHLSSPALAGAAHFPMTVVGVAHSCLATWWTTLREGPPPPDFAWRIAAVARGYAACDALIAPTAAFAAATCQSYGVSPIPVHNGRSRTATVATARDIPVVTAGRLWDEGKGAATLDAAAEMLGVPVLALGPMTGPQGQRVTLDRLCFAGAKPAAAVAETLARARIFVSAARYEPFGLAVLEAAQAGCALVLSDIPTFRELWEGAAVFVTPGDPAVLAKAVTELLRNPIELERLSTAARIRAECYDLDGWIDATRAIHRACLQHLGATGAAA